MKKTFLEVTNLNLTPTPEVPGAAETAPDNDDERKIAGDGRFQVITFFLNSVEYAIEVKEAVEVLKPRVVTEVPRTPEFIRGILSVRGEMVPILDLKLMLAAGASEKGRGRILITSFDDAKTGFLVDRLSGVKELPSRSVSSVPPDCEASTARFLKGVIKTESSSILLLDTGKLVGFAEA